MVHYHGTPITPDEVISKALRGAHFCISFNRPDQLVLVTENASSWCGDNGAFHFWKAGIKMDSWQPFYDWAYEASFFPNCDFVFIPDVIDGDEDANDALLAEWPMDFHYGFGVPVWHLHESLERLDRLVTRYPRVALGSSGVYAQIGTQAWDRRMHEAWEVICDERKRPRTKIHGLRMLDPDIVRAFPFASCDSCNIALNIGKDCRWKGTYQPVSKQGRAAAMREIIEHALPPVTYKKRDLAILSDERLF